MQLLLIVNPKASSVTPRNRTAIADALAAEHDLQVAETSYRDHASDLAAGAARDGVDVVAVLAGDGTLNEAAQGLVGTSTALAALPGGSTNVFARTLGVAFGPLDACTQLLRSLQESKTTRVGVGTATNAGMSRRFVFHLGLGFDAAIIREMEMRHAHLKRYLAHPAFAATTVATWLRHYDRSTAIVVEAHGGNGPATMASGPYAVISNSTPYTYVGRRPVTIAPDARLDGALAVTVFCSLDIGLLVRAGASGLGRAEFLSRSPRIAQVPDVQRVTVNGDRPFPWQVDGDYLGTTTHLDVVYEPDALTLVVP